MSTHRIARRAGFGVELLLLVIFAFVSLSGVLNGPLTVSIFATLIGFWLAFAFVGPRTTRTPDGRGGPIDLGRPSLADLTLGARVDDGRIGSHPPMGAPHVDPCLLELGWRVWVAPEGLAPPV